MLVFDAVIYNEDRHFGNFGVLMDSHTCQIKGAAPVFDNGVSLFNYAMQDDIDNLAEYAKTIIFIVYHMKLYSESWLVAFKESS